ncbi:ubiquitin-like protein 4A [Lineus longissimus]|uniref:ubiquitin-like protein 4A n=1 Tax=Lineus longissimus TaxID=88925 RepID=UPI002B4F120A
MDITVKILQGQELFIKITCDATVADLKSKVSEQIGVAPDQQRVVFKGKALPDHSKLRDCEVVSGSKLFLTIKKTATITPPDAKLTQKPTSTSTSALWEEMLKFLKRHFTETDAKKVLEKMKEHHHGRLNSLSLDDIERLAHMNLEARKQNSR